MVIQVLSVNYLLVTTKLLVEDNWKYYGNGTRIGSILVKKNLITYSYILKEFLIISRSEHSFGGKYGDMEIQLVHEKDQNWLVSQEILVDPDAGNDLLIISIIFNVTSTATTNLNIERLNLGKDLPMNNFDLSIYPPIGKPFYFYLGSLTRPNCTEDVNWIVVNEIIEITQTQLNDLQLWIKKHYNSGFNNRETQQVNSRKLYYQYYPYQINYNDNTSLGRSLVFGLNSLRNISLLIFCFYL